MLLVSLKTFKRRSEDCSLNADGLIIEIPENTKLFIFFFSASPGTNFIITQAKHSFKSKPIRNVNNISNKFLCKGIFNKWIKTKDTLK